jgi:glutamate formiminotransferase/formiminotetrahydrofolate cyclodeaminase
MKLMECVPNFSEGRNRATIDAIAEVIRAAPGVTLLDVDPGQDTNRTVVTFVGDPASVVHAAFESIKKAASLIDMRHHRGEHARMGATDVCPLIPISGVTQEEAIEWSRSLAKRVGEELNIPVFLYEHSATEKNRVNLANIRSGEFEGMSEKLKDPRWQPDFGPRIRHETAGVTAIGVREFLIAYNVNLNTKDTKLAKDIALDIREQGRRLKDEGGKSIRDAQGNFMQQPGLLKHCKAVGWYIDAYQMAQVSINLTNFRVTNLHHAFEAVREGARKRGIRVTGSELVGLLPLEALLEAGRYYLAEQGQSRSVSERDLIRVAVQSLGLSELDPFRVEEKIIEYRIGSPLGSLAGMTLSAFADETASDSPAPGGGSISAYAGALGAALISMVGNLTFGLKKFADRREEMESLAMEGQRLKHRLLVLLDADTEAFQGVLEAMRLPKKTEEEQQRRLKAVEAATQKATQVPFEVLSLCEQLMPLALTVLERGNPNSASDAAVAGEMAHAAAHGAALNVRINLKGITTVSFKETLLKATQEKLDSVNAHLVRLRDRANHVI